MRMTVRAGLLGLITAPTLAQDCHPVFRQRLLASDGAPGDWFGTAIDLKDGHLAINAKFDDSPQFNRGSVYMYRWDGIRWSQYSQLVPPDSSQLQYFGDSVELTPDAQWLVAGADGDDDRGQYSGSVYVFRRNDFQWLFDGELHANDGSSYDGLGYNVAVEYPYVFASADGTDDRGADSGSLYVFKHEGQVWTQVAELQPSDLRAGDRFGTGNAAQGAWVVAAAQRSDAIATDGGAVYVYKNLGGDLWSLAQKLAPLDLEPGDELGWSVELASDWLAVGSRYADRSGVVDSGTVYLYRLDGNTWIEFQQLEWSQTHAGAQFGASVALAPDTLAVGANFADHAGQDSGSIVLFRYDGAAWNEITTLTAPGVDAGDVFGTSCELDEAGDWMVGSAIWDEPFGNESGAAYAFALRCRCLGDFDADGTVNTRDVLAFLNAWTVGSLLADFNGDGQVNTVDVIAFLNAWNAGC